MERDATPSAPLADQAARDAIRNHLDTNMVVEAAAGTGKTTALVARIIEVIRTGTGELAHLVAVTFTEKAAGELKLRLRNELETARNRAIGADDRETLKRLDRGLEQLEEAHIGTIHGFCADLLRIRPLQAGVDPMFEMASEEEKLRLYGRAFDRWFERKLADPPPGIRRLMRRRGRRQYGTRKERGPVDELRKAGLDLIEVRDFPTPWDIRPFEREIEIEDLAERVLRLADMSVECTNPEDNLYKNLAGLQSIASELRRYRDLSTDWDYDSLEHRLPSLWLGRHKGRGPYGGSVSRETILAEREALDLTFRDFKKRAGADLATHLQHELTELVEDYQKLKEKSGRLDFLDLLVGARNLLRDHRDLRAKLQEEFTHLFVDEFQDTDPLQAEILLLLSANDPDEADWRRITPTPGKLFIVADPKQSIYRFRRAHVALYERVKKNLIAAGAEFVHLNVSFRAVPELQELVNTAFSKVMKRSDTNHQADYVPLDPSRDSITDQPPVVALPIPRPFNEWGYVTNKAVAKSEPGVIAGWLHWLLEESGWRVTSREHPTEPRPVTPSDVCLLFRRFVSFGNDITRPYVEALQSFDIQHVLVGGRGFHQREEVEAMRTALAAIERPDDELSVFATLRGPLFSFDDDALFRFRSQYKSFHPFHERPEPVDTWDRTIQEALGELARLHKGRNRRPIALTIRKLLDVTRAQAGFALWQAGDQTLANVMRLLQLARNFEASGGLSFRGFVDQLEEQAESGESQEQPLLEEGIEGVRVMTAHKAKGLEFPIIVLCDITCRMSGGASRHIDTMRKLFAVRLAGGSPWEIIDNEEIEAERDEAEAQRLLYVAATRARDLLVVPAVADEEQKGWVDTLNPTLYPDGRSYHLPMVAPGCPRFGMETVVDRPSRSAVPPGEGLRPGLHKPRRGGHRVVWWDPSLLGDEGEVKPGIRRHWILQEAETATASAASQEEYEQWNQQRSDVVASGGQPLHRVTTATRWANPRGEVDLVPVEIAVEPENVDVIVLERDVERPAGVGFGTLVHEILARCSLAASADDVRNLAETVARMLGSDDEEVEAAARAVDQALEHPLLEKARQAEASGQMYRETPLVHRAEDGALVEGVPDLAFRSDADERWTVVDFKTDLRADIDQDVYRRQVALYVKTLAEATGSPARGVLLYV